MSTDNDPKFTKLKTVYATLLKQFELLTAKYKRLQHENKMLQNQVNALMRRNGNG